MPRRRTLVALVWAVPLLLFASPSELLALASAILLHEGGHLLAFFLLGEPPPRPSAVLTGMTLSPTRPLPYRHELVIAAAGPLLNLLVALPLLSFGTGAATLTLGAVHLLTALANLLPLGGSDGSRIARSLLALLLPLRLAEGVASALSLFSFFLLLFFLLFLLLFEGGGGVLLLLLSLLTRAVCSR